ncbi:MAG: PucR family transcriptional regulator ligand-binding domain-containing protein [Clostridiales bacterium]|nr:PucR family transcriptional regulator ligand-binding domain-containing protein [Candidatus Blautia equi]
MGLTIEDMLTISRERHEMEMAGGKNGWSNSINWILQVEDITILNNFKGKELAVTTGLGFGSEERLMELAEKLVEHHASGLVINTGKYILTLPEPLVAYCDTNDLPLLTVPWQTDILEMIKDLSVNIFLQNAADEQISNALIHAIEEPEAMDLYRKDLLPYFDIDDSFQIALISTGDLDVMDTVERRRLAYQMHIYLENITHNGSFFYYDSSFVLVINALKEKQVREIIDGFAARVKRKLKDRKLYVGVGSKILDVSSLHVAYQRAKAALRMAMKREENLLYFDDMGLYRLLYTLPDQKLLEEMGPDLIRPLINYDLKHNTNYVETLEAYLKYNGSIQAVAEELYTHRNTVIYRVNNIKKLLDCQLESAEERMRYRIACMIAEM